jgi:hypothetical protein
MMKSLVANSVAVLPNIIKDVKAAYPTMKSLDKDLERLFTLVANRGMASLMLDLPNLDSILLKGIETGRLSLEGPLSTAVSKKIHVPRLFSGLWLRIFNSSGAIRSDPDVNSILMLRFVSNFFKKIEVRCSPSRMSNAVGEYYDIEECLRDPDLLWSDSEFDHFERIHSVHFCDGLDDAHAIPSTSSGGMAKVECLAYRLQRICDSVAGELGYFDPYTFTGAVGRSDCAKRYLSHGRGSVSDLKRYEDKYVLPGWSERLQRVFPHDAFGCYRFDNTLEYDKWNDAPTSKLIAVPKTLAKPRLIASEPVANQWCQQITLRFLVERMKDTRLGWFLDLSNQKLSQDMVLLQSTLRNGESRLATVDLSSASDRLTCWAIERFLRRNPPLLDALQASRTPFLRDGVTGRKELPLKKFASQGTGVTFPIQSLFFLCCALASLGCTSLKHAKHWKGQVRVYGDDIIIPKHGYDNLRLLLSFLELKVNEDKSFVNGGFKESCGMDAFRGYDVTPVRPKTLVVRGPKTEQAMLDVANNLFKKGFWHTAKWFDSTIEKGNYFPIIGLQSGATGRVSFCGGKVDHLKSRWNPDYQRDEIRVTTYNSRTPVISHSTTSGIFQYFAENPSQDQKWSSGVRQESTLRKKYGWVASRECVSDCTPTF